MDPILQYATALAEEMIRVGLEVPDRATLISSLYDQIVMSVQEGAEGGPATDQYNRIVSSIVKAGGSPPPPPSAPVRPATDERARARLEEDVSAGIVSADERMGIIRSGYGLDKAGVSPPAFRGTEAGVRLESQLGQEQSQRDFENAMRRFQEEEGGRNRRAALEQSVQAFTGALPSMLPSGADFGGFQPGGPLQALSNIGGFAGGFEGRAQPVQTNISQEDMLRTLMPSQGGR